MTKFCSAAPKEAGLSGVYINMLLARAVLVIYIILGSFLALGQEGRQIELNFRLSYNGQPVLLGDRWYRLQQDDSVSFETFRCYISGLALYKDGAVVFSKTGDIYLLNAEADSMDVRFMPPAGIMYDAVGFNIGIDSVTNSLGVSDGVLDPVNGMYWTWQAGYINVKLEGHSNRCPTRRNRFQFHLGGFLSPGYALQHVVIPVSSHSSVVDIDLPLDKFISGIGLNRQHTVMRPGPEAVQLSKQLASLLEINK